MSEARSQMTIVEQAERPPAQPVAGRMGPVQDPQRRHGGGGRFHCDHAVCAGGPYLWKVDPGYANLLQRNKAPSMQFPFGTDELRT